MISDYLVQAPSDPAFSQSEKEYQQTTRAYPSLVSVSDSDDLNYDSYSATAGINAS